MAESQAKSQLDRIEQDIAEVKRWINGSNGDPGVKVRLDRLERSWKVVTWASGVIFTGIIGWLTKMKMG